MMKFEIWYMKPEWFSKGGIGERPDPENLSTTHVHLKDIDCNGTLEDIWEMMQGENWSPNGEARELILAKGLRHTSMSVGDVIVVNGESYVIASATFDKLSD